MSAVFNFQKCFFKYSNYRRSTQAWCSIIRFNSNFALYYDRDPGESFVRADIQKLLTSMTGFQQDKIFKKRSVSDNTTKYKFMTAEQLKKEFNKISQQATKQLQMPPVIKVKEDKRKVVSADPALQDFSNAAFVITDVTYGFKHSDRKIVIRHNNGTLEYVSQTLHKKMNQIYFPLSGRKLRLPLMFEEEHLNRCLEENMYDFILDRLCVQFEPYEKLFHDISSRVYLHVIQTKQFHILRSTRHFGPMAFFLAWHNIIDDLLCDMIKRDSAKNAVELITLMYILNNIEYDKSVLNTILSKKSSLDDKSRIKFVQKGRDEFYQKIENTIGKSNRDFEIDEICLDFIENYVKNKAMKKVPLELSLQAFRETNSEKKKLYDGLRKAHGIN